MKIIVSHPDTQHVRILLNFLVKKKWLVKFYTSVSIPNSVIKYSPEKYKPLLKKRYFPNVPQRVIQTFFWTFLIEKLFSKNVIDSIKSGYYLFDLWVSYKIIKNNADIVIAYENANLFTFKKAKKNRKVTILDLAHIHHITSTEISENFEILSSRNISIDEQEYMNNRKQRALELTDYIFVLSEFAKKSLVSNGIPEKKIYKIYLGVDNTIFYRKSQYNQPTSKFRLLFVGTLTLLKGLSTLLKAFDELNLVDAELLLIGPLSDAQSLLHEFEGKYQHIQYLPHKELAEEYRKADIFIFPSYLDSWAQTVIEAMACGTPVIVSDNTGAKDAVEKGGGFIVPTGDLESLKEKMKFFYENRDIVKTMGERAAEVAALYSIDNYEKMLSNALIDICNREGLKF